MPAYASKNGPLTRSMAAPGPRRHALLLYGVDANRNTNADQSEPSGETLVNVDNLTRRPRLAAYLTCTAMKAIRRRTARPRST